MDPEYGKGYRELYERHWWWRSREVAVLSVLHRHRGSASPARILDIGCGDGLFFRALEEFGEVEGLESSAALISPHGPYRARIHVAPFDARFRSSKEYDLILMLDVLEHLDNPAEALRLAASLLPPGGSLLLTVPAFRLLWTNHDLINHHRTRYRRGTLRPLLKEAGFLVVDQRYWYQWTCPVKLAQRFVEGFFRLPPALPTVPPHWLNTLLYRFSRFEQETLGAWGIPFGSSLMMYCRKANR